jgi:succinoglycan biosynthesis transport protein ExoP
VESRAVSEFSLRDLLRILRQRRTTLYGTTAVIFAVSILLCFVMTRRYETTGVFQLQKSTADSLDLESLMGGGGGGASDSLTVNTELQTEADILKSDTLALQVINDLNLENNGDFQPRFTFISEILNWFNPAGPQDTAGATLENSPHRRVRVVRAFESHLTVRVEAGTRLIEVQYSNRDPKVAAAVVNHLIQALIDFSFQTKFTATNKISGWLEEQLGDLRKQSEDLQAKVVALQQGSGIFGVGGTDLQGKPVVYSPVLDRLQESSALLTQAKMNRIVKESVYKTVQDGNAEMISQLLGTAMISQSGQGVQNSLTLVQGLRTQEATLKAQIQQDQSQFGPKYPKLIEEQASLSSVEASIKAEIDRIASRAKNDYHIALESEQGALANYDSDRKAAERLNDKTIEYTILSRESEQSQNLYQDLLKRLKEAGILEGLRSSNITIVDVARIPDVPNRPNIRLILIAGLITGFISGAILALLMDSIDNKIQSIEDIENMQIPVLGILPLFKPTKMNEEIALLDPEASEFGESIRRLRSTMLISRGGSPPQIFLITSGSPSEGKSTVALNFAAALAQYNKSVLLVESDMRRPVLAKRLQLDPSMGLSQFLVNPLASIAPIQVPAVPRLFIFPGGPVPPYPSELLGSASLDLIIAEWRRAYDFIVIDSPPILPVTDVQILASHVDATILIARAGFTTRPGLSRAYKLLFPHAKDPSQPAIGTVLNAISKSSAAYYRYYGEYGHGYRNYYSGKEGRDE